MQITPKAKIMDIEPYKGGLSKTKRDTKVIKLSSNENPYGPSPKAITAYNACAESLHRYPDSSARDLKHAIAETFDLNVEHIICGAGSDEIISLLCQAYAGLGDEVIYTEHGFLMYKISSLAVGATPIAVAEVDLSTDVDNILDAVTDKTRIVFIANPNNPTGSYIDVGEVKRLRDGLPDNVLLVLDGAYAEYMSQPDYCAGASIVDMGQNTVMTRTFSKIFGLPALRIGWAYCPVEIIDVLNRIRGPFNVSSPAIAAAIAAVQDNEYMDRARVYNADALDYFIVSLQEIGLEYVPSVANFILVKFSGDQHAQAAYEHLMSEGIIVRPVANYGLPEYLRITMGTEEENKIVVRALTNFLKDN